LILVLGTACLSERAPPSPPILQIVLNQTQVTSPDTLTGTVRAEDRDGIDSVWVTVDDQRAGQDGFFETVVVAPFRFLIPPGLPQTTVLPVRLEARDIAGFSTTLDTIVVVVP
jgi:hypothetical protein